MSFRMRKIAHPVVRQFILRTAVINYLGKCLKLQWDDWQNQRMQMRTLQHENTKPVEVGDHDVDNVAASVILEQSIEVLRQKVNASHTLLEKEYHELFLYMMDKRDLWDSPEYFKAKTALGTANHNLRMYNSSDKSEFDSEEFTNLLQFSEEC